MRVNKKLDFIERVAWTFIQVEISLGAMDWLNDGINLSFAHKLYVSLGAAVAATIKVLIAQRAGSEGLGDAIPGQVIESK